MTNDWKKAYMALKKDGIAFVPTDTIYGIVANALSPKAVERVYGVRGRDKDKPCIILISSFKDIEKFGVKFNAIQKNFLETVWPGKVSVILPVKDMQWKYLHRGKKSLAFRMIAPRNKNLYHLIKTIGPLVAPSANPQGQKPAEKRSEGRAYFGNGIDAYVCVGTRNAPPSTLVDYTKDKPIILRQGAVKIKKD
jgi:L-threonylcarbamoyladenylate synthase